MESNKDNLWNSTKDAPHTHLSLHTCCCLFVRISSPELGRNEIGVLEKTMPLRAAVEQASSAREGLLNP